MTSPTGAVTFSGPVLPNTVVTPVAPIWVDHSNLTDFNSAVSASAYRTPGATQTATQVFWSTDPRPASSTVQETLEIMLSSERLVNWLKFDVAIFPHVLTIECYDLGRAKWMPMLDLQRTPLTQTISRSIPVQLPNPTNVPGRLHPQHSFLGHWRTASFTTKPTYVQRLRFVLNRIDNGLGPVGVLGKPVDYSLAMRNIGVGYQVASRQDVPRSLPTTTPYSAPFASTDDLLGSSLAFSMRDPTADRIMGNIDSDADIIWMCEPQPYPGAVVCFYADLRDAMGDPQVIDQIFLNPVTSGAHVTVYWSNDMPMGDFDAVSTPLGTPLVTQFGDVVIQDARLSFGDYGDTAALSIINVPEDGNAMLGFVPAEPWWLGVTVRAGFTRGADTNEHPIYDCGHWRLSLTADGITLFLGDMDMHVCPITYVGSQDISVVVSYDGEGTFHMHARTNTDDQTADFWAQPMMMDVCPTIMLGGNLGLEYFLNSDLINLVLKEEMADGLDDFLNNPGSYCTVAQFEADDLPQSRNAILRLDPTATHLIDSAHPWGLFGGPGMRYESLLWSPVPRDYLMQRGWMYLPPTQARFLKLEITNLQAVPYDIAVPGPQAVKTFPPEVLAHYRQRLVNTSSQTTPLGIDTQIGLSGQNSYFDVPAYIGTGGNANRGYTNTEVFIADDFTTGQRLRRIQSANWGYQTFHVGTDAPRFATAQVHHYTEETITRTNKVAYQCGLRQIVFAVSSFTSQQDTGMYDENFYTIDNLSDDTNLTNLIYDPELDA